MYANFSCLRNTDITWGFVTKGDLLNLQQVFSICSRRIHTYIHFHSLRCSMGTLRRRYIGIRECSGHGAEIFEEWRAGVLECRKMGYPEGCQQSGVQARLCSMGCLVATTRGRDFTIKTELQT
jgi:hypothetical protein